MTEFLVTVLSLAYILGLWASQVPGQLGGIGLGGWGLVALGISAAAILPKVWRTGPRPWAYLLAGILGLLACLYITWRVPQPAVTDISHTLGGESADRPTIVLVDGTVTSTPRLTRGQKRQFWLAATRLSEVVGQTVVSGQAVSGRVYVTMPAAVAEKVRPGHRVTIRGALYLPKPAANPEGFDLQAYLRDQDCFAGLAGWELTGADRPSPWGWWQVRQRIVQAQGRWLGSPEGPLVSAMVMGSRSVDLPYDVRDAFAKTGLAHALAASGFHVSLIIGVIMALTRRFSSRVQAYSSLVALSLFVGLTGAQPSVMRAAVMGVGALVGLLMERRIKPLGSLLLATTLLLLCQPLWIWDLGFQLSVLATLGLLVTVSPLTRWLDWLPTTIAPLVAVPIAAYLWTLPLQLYAFGVVSPYSIPLNIVTTPLISIISLGGFLSAVVALGIPIVGSALAWLLAYPTQGLIYLVQLVARLPGSNLATGSITLWQLLGLYGLVGLVWWQGWRRYRATTEKRRLRWSIPKDPLVALSLALAISLVMVPAWQRSRTLVQMTLLATPGETLVFWQDQGQVGLMGDVSEKAASLTVLPFLQSRGVNRLDWVVMLDSLDLAPKPQKPPRRSGWSTILNRVPSRALYYPPTLTVAPSLLQAVAQHGGNSQALARRNTLGSLTLHLPTPTSSLLTIQRDATQWLWLGATPHPTQAQLAATGALSPTQALWWTGDSLSGQLLKATSPQWAIATAPRLKADTLDRLRKRHIQLFWTTRDGSIQWTPSAGFYPAFNGYRGTAM